MFFIYINELSDDFQCNPTLFADDTLLFVAVLNINKATNGLDSI